jgi:histidyl-tRNA synthetase
MKKPKYKTPTGMHDILPEDQKYFDKVFDVVRQMANFYGFKRIETPLLEETELFSRGIGLATEIVKKQMFTFKTKGGDHLSLRPEGTAPVVRAFIEHGMQNFPQPVKLWYFGPFFRYERPQLGRYRQFWQFGFEILGSQSSVLDAQVIQIFINILRELKFKDLIIQINSIGCSQCRPYYKKILTNYFKSRVSSLCQDCRKRLVENPLRILDCKDEKCQRIILNAPQIVDHLCEQCHLHFKEVLEFLDELQLPYHLNPYLVRGLDYYTRTVFEIFEEKEIGALVGGGRYDNLAKILGGGTVPAVGGAGGIERIVLSLKKKAIKLQKESKPKVFLAQLGELAKKKSLKLIEEFRLAKIPIAESLSRDSLKSQMKVADRMGIRYVLILGQKEALEDKIIIRDMVSGKQKVVELKKVVKEIRKKL